MVSLEPVEAFGEIFRLEAAGQGAEDAEHIVFVSDGRPLDPGRGPDPFPEALSILDLWHLQRAYRDTLGAERPAIPVLPAAARAGQPAELLQRLHRLAGRAPTPEERARRSPRVPGVSGRGTIALDGRT